MQPPQSNALKFIPDPPYKRRFSSMRLALTNLFVAIDAGTGIQLRFEVLPLPYLNKVTVSYLVPSALFAEPQTVRYSYL